MSEHTSGLTVVPFEVPIEKDGIYWLAITDGQVGVYESVRTRHLRLPWRKSSWHFLHFWRPRRPWYYVSTPSTLIAKQDRDG